SNGGRSCHSANQRRGRVRRASRRALVPTWWLPSKRSSPRRHEVRVSSASLGTAWASEQPIRSAASAGPGTPNRTRPLLTARAGGGCKMGPACGRAEPRPLHAGVGAALRPPPRHDRAREALPLGDEHQEHAPVGIDDQLGLTPRGRTGVGATRENRPWQTLFLWESVAQLVTVKRNLLCARE